MTAIRKKITFATMMGISVSAAMAGCSTTGTDAPNSPSPSNASVAASGSPSRRDSAYADGTYTATGWYGGLPSNIDVSLILVDDVITSVEVTPHATDPTSRDYQDRFADAIPALVVGRNIDEVNVDRVAGSSGTPDGFNDAIEQIKAQASS